MLVVSVRIFSCVSVIFVLFMACLVSLSDALLSFKDHRALDCVVFSHEGYVSFWLSCDMKTDQCDCIKD